MKRSLALIGAAVLASQAPAWNDAGHEAIARLAYHRLSATDRKKIDRLLASLPDPHTPKGSVQASNPFGDPPSVKAQGAAVLLREPTIQSAATWPDHARLTWLSHPTWHYVDLSLGPNGDGRDLGGQALQAVPRLIAIVRDAKASRETRAMALAWTIHIVGDLHQPLHAATFIGPDTPKGDHGGNDYFKAVPKGAKGHGRNLHHDWDYLAGTKADPVVLAIEAGPAATSPAFSLAKAPDTLMDWAQESLRIADESVYRQHGAGSDWLSNDPALPYPDGYTARGRILAYERINLAGSHLAALLQAALKGVTTPKA